MVLPFEADERRGSDAATDGPLGDGTSSDAPDAGDGAPLSDGRGGLEGGLPGGPLTFVAREWEFLPDRLWDLDGDGLPDNAIAELGSPSSSLFCSTLSSLVNGRMENRNRFVVHFPWVETLGPPSDPEVVVVPFSGMDTDDPVNLSDDFSGSEPFFVSGYSLDACGEPLYPSWGGIEAGHLTASIDAWPIPLGLGVAARDARVTGQIDDRAGESELTLSGGLLASDLGASVEFTMGTTNMTFLELVVAGGAPFGFPTMPGLTPDLDLDGDGLERFELSEGGHISACIDGDLTVIDGRDCWQDERIADGFSAVLRLELVAAAFAGFEPDWEHWTEETCDEPPEESLWDPR